MDDSETARGVDFGSKIGIGVRCQSPSIWNEKISEEIEAEKEEGTNKLLVVKTFDVFDDRAERSESTVRQKRVHDHSEIGDFFDGWDRREGGFVPPHFRCQAGVFIIQDCVGSLSVQG